MLTKPVATPGGSVRGHPGFQDVVRRDEGRLMLILIILKPLRRLLAVVLALLALPAWVILGVLPIGVGKVDRWMDSYHEALVRWAKGV
jgi:membrane protein required for beta-lactamase induction